MVHPRRQEEHRIHGTRPETIKTDQVGEIAAVIEAVRSVLLFQALNIVTDSNPPRYLTICWSEKHTVLPMGAGRHTS